MNKKTDKAKTKNQYNLKAYLKKHQKKLKESIKQGNVDSTVEQSRMKMIFQTFNETQKKINKEYKELDKENKFFSKDYKNFTSRINKKLEAKEIFADLIHKYKEKGYKIPDLSTKHNIFNPTPLLLEGNNINRYFRNKYFNGTQDKILQDHTIDYLLNLNTRVENEKLKKNMRENSVRKGRMDHALRSLQTIRMKINTVDYDTENPKLEKEIEKLEDSINNISFFNKTHSKLQHCLTNKNRNKTSISFGNVPGTPSNKKMHSSKRNIRVLINLNNFPGINNNSTSNNNNNTIITNPFNATSTTFQTTGFSYNAGSTTTRSRNQDSSSFLEKVHKSSKSDFLDYFYTLQPDDMRSETNKELFKIYCQKYLKYNDDKIKSIFTPNGDCSDLAEEICHTQRINSRAKVLESIPIGYKRNLSARRKIKNMDDQIKYLTKDMEKKVMMIAADD